MPDPDTCLTILYVTVDDFFQDEDAPPPSAGRLLGRPNPAFVDPVDWQAHFTPSVSSFSSCPTN